MHAVPVAPIFNGCNAACKRFRVERSPVLQGRPSIVRVREDRLRRPAEKTALPHRGAPRHGAEEIPPPHRGEPATSPARRRAAITPAADLAGVAPAICVGQPRWRARRASRRQDRSRGRARRRRGAVPGAGSGLPGSRRRQRAEDPVRCARFVTSM